MTGWQPIETAPKDGTNILASNGKWVNVVYWDDDHWDEFMIAPQLMARGATHWQPLPEPPSSVPEREQA